MSVNWAGKEKEVGDLPAERTRLGRTEFERPEKFPANFPVTEPKWYRPPQTKKVLPSSTLNEALKSLEKKIFELDEMQRRLSFVASEVRASLRQRNY